MLDDSITELLVEDRNVKTDNDPDKPEYDSENVQLNVNQQSYGEQQVTDDISNMTKNRFQKITRAPKHWEKQKA